MVNTAACKRGGPRFKSQNGRELLTRNNKDLVIWIWIVAWHISSSHNNMQDPCRAQLAGHTSNKTWPAQMRETWNNILAAHVSEISLFYTTKVSMEMFTKFFISISEWRWIPASIFAWVFDLLSKERKKRFVLLLCLKSTWAQFFTCTKKTTSCPFSGFFE